MPTRMENRRNMNGESAPQDSMHGQFIGAIVLFGALGAVVFNILPLFLGAASDSLALSDTQLGFLGSAYLGGYGVMIAAGFFWVDRWPWRRSLATALLGAATLFVAVGFTQDFTLVAMLIAGSGVCLGTLYGLGYPAIARLPNPERLIGIKMAAEALLGMSLLLILPTLVVGAWGFRGLVWVLGGLCLIGLAAVPIFPQPSELPPEDKIDAPSANDRRSVFLGLGGLALYTAGMTGIWAFVERLGVEAGFGAGQIGAVLGASLIAAVLAAFAAAAKGEAGNQLLPHVVALVGLAISATLCLSDGGFPAYAAGVILLNGTWFFVFPFQQALATRIATSERVVMLVPAMSALGAAAGPGLAGLAKGDGGFLSVFLLGGLTSVVGFLAFRGVLGGLAKSATHPTDSTKDAGS